jgi:hypothetical protein
VSCRPALLLLALVVAAPAAGQDAGRVPANGTEAFRFGLHLQNLRPISRPAEALDNPRHTMIVFVGSPAVNNFAEPGRLRAYLKDGGAVLVASDQPAGRFGPGAGGAGDWADQFGIRITGTRLTADVAHSYHKQTGQPFVKPRADVAAGGASPHDLFTGVEEAGPNAVATDRPSEMSVQAPAGWAVENLAGYPDGTRHQLDGLPVDPSLNNFALSLQPEGRGWDADGRLLVVANRAVFTNGMMGVVRDPAAPGQFTLDNGNWGFATRTIQWLKGGAGEPRTACLFIQDGRVIDRFAVELPGTPQPPMPNIPPDVIANWVLNHANGIIDEKQQEDVFNQTLLRKFGLPRMLRAFLILATLALALVGLRWLIRGRRKAEPTAVLTPFARDNLLPKGGVLRQRTAAQIEVGNLYEAARRRVRERFDVLGGRPGASGQMPPVLTANDLPDGPLLYQSVRWLWALGYGETPLAVPPTDWDRTNMMLERVTARAARGDWSFGQDAN